MRFLPITIAAIVLAFHSPTNAAPKSPADGAKWIWHASPATSKASRLKREFEIKDPAAISKATLHVTCDNGAKVYLNDKLIAENADWMHPTKEEIKKHLKSGNNVLRAEATNRGGVGGFIPIPYAWNN